MRRSDEIIFIGLSITSSWRNGHAPTYRALIHGLHRLGQKVLFLERDRPWYASNRDAPVLSYCQSRLYVDVDELRARYTPRIRAAAAVIVGSRVDDGRDVCDWVLDHATGLKAFYDIDAPATVAGLQADSCKYLRAAQVPEFDVILSIAGGPQLQLIENELGARRAAPLYRSVDVDLHRPMGLRRDIDLGYLGNYSDHRQPALEQLLNEPARRLPKRRFAVAGTEYPSHLAWPKNVQRIDHMTPGSHAQFYGRQRFTLHLTHSSMPLLEAAACGTPIIASKRDGIDALLEPGKEILLARSAEEVTHYLENITDVEAERMAAAARERICANDSSVVRAAELMRHLAAARESSVRVSEEVLAAS